MVGILRLDESPDYPKRKSAPPRLFHVWLLSKARIVTPTPIVTRETASGAPPGLCLAHNSA